MRNTQRARGATHQQVIQLRHRQIAGHLMENINQRATTIRLGLYALQRFFRAHQRLTGAAQHGARAQLRLHSCEQFFGPERFADEIRRAQSKRAHRSFLGRQGRQHQHRQITPALFTFDFFEQLTPISIGHQNIHQQQVGRAGLQLLHGRHTTRRARNFVPILAQQP